MRTVFLFLNILAWVGCAGVPPTTIDGRGNGGEAEKVYLENLEPPVINTNPCDPDPLALPPEMVRQADTRAIMVEVLGYAHKHFGGMEQIMFNLPEGSAPGAYVEVVERLDGAVPMSRVGEPAYHLIVVVQVGNDAEVDLLFPSPFINNFRGGYVMKTIFLERKKHGGLRTRPEWNALSHGLGRVGHEPPPPSFSHAKPLPIPQFRF